MENNKVICSKPFTTIHNQIGKNYTPCCWARKSQFGPQDTLPIDYFDSEEFRRIRKEMLVGEKTEFLESVCRICHNLENENNNSPRQQFKLNKELLKNFNEDGSLKPTNNRFLTISINFYGNYCNLECYACEASNSTSRNAALKKLNPKWNNFKHLSVEDNLISDIQRFDKDQFVKIVGQLIKYSHNISVIEIVGGEPMLMKSHFKLLDELILCGQSKNIILSYVSNMTLLGLDVMQKYFEKFNYTYIQWSVDALEDRNYWLRYPTDWNSTTKNVFDVQNYLSQYNKGKIQATITPSLLSIVTLKKTAIWLQLRKLFLPSNHIYNTLIDPKILRPRNLPLDLKQKIAMSVKSISKFHYNDLMQNGSEDDFNLAIEYFDDLDRSRGTNWRSTFPEVAKYAN
jgi:hypothetical protein